MKKGAPPVDCARVFAPYDEQEIVDLFNKTCSLKSGDQEIYAIVEKHFLETLVRLHHASKGELFTGLKPAGSAEPIVNMSGKWINRNK